MRTLIFIFLLSPFFLHAQTGWIENGRTQTWGGPGFKVTIYLRDSITGKDLPPITNGYVTVKAQQYYERIYINDSVTGKERSVIQLDRTRGTDWNKVVAVLDKNHKQIPWRMFDHYSAQEPGNLKMHEK